MARGSRNQTQYQSDSSPRKKRARKGEGELTGDRMQQLGCALVKERDRWVEARQASGVERRWLEDMAHYHGRDINAGPQQMTRQAHEGGANRQDGRNLNGETGSRVFVNITRSKTNAAEARIANMLFPVDEKNWGIGPTPVPSLASQIMSPVVITQGGVPLKGPNGELTGGDLAKAMLEDARKRADAMEKEIDDQLTECRYNAEGRHVIRDAVRLGTGIMKGPVIRGQIDRKWSSQAVTNPDGKTTTVYQIEMREKQTPVSYRKSIWDVFTDPCCGGNPHDGAGIWERDRLTRRKLRDLSRVEGYKSDQILLCLQESPHRTNVYDTYESELLVENGIDALANDTRYEMWTYTGDMTRENLEAAGVELPEKAELQTVSGVVSIVNGRVIKAHLNPLDTGDLPFDFFNFEECEGSPWGYGVPYLMRTGQRIINAGWRQMMDNAGASVGPQIVIRKDQIEPANGSYQIRGNKVWYANDEALDVKKSMEVFQVDARLNDLIAIIKFALQFIDEETGVPMLLQGEKGTAPDTVGGMTMLMNAANELLKNVAKRFDDNLTTPHIRRYYDFNMQYNPKEEIKGDLQVDARGTSALVVRDLQNQAILQMLALANNPIWAAGLKKWALLRKAFAANHLVAEDFVESDEIIQSREQQMAQGQTDPAIEVEKMRSDLKMQELQFQRESQAAALNMEKQIAVLNYAKEVKLSEQKLKAMLADKVIGIRNERELFVAERALKMDPRNPTNQGI